MPLLDEQLQSQGKNTQGFDTPRALNHNQLCNMKLFRVSKLRTRQPHSPHFAEESKLRGCLVYSQMSSQGSLVSSKEKESLSPNLIFIQRRRLQRLRE